MATIPINGYINLAASLMETDGKPQLESVQIGKLMLPDVLTQILALQFMDWLRQSAEYQSGARLAENGSNCRATNWVSYYRWAGGFSKGMRASIIDKQERERLLHYQSILAANSVRNGAIMPLSEILPPLVRVAAARSVNGDALAENRAVILVVTFHVLGVSLKRILPEAANWPRSAPQSITLDGRDDFAKHFMASATIAAYADTHYPMQSDCIRRSRIPCMAAASRSTILPRTAQVRNLGKRQ